MSDINILKKAFISIGCNFASCNTLTGHEIHIQTISGETIFEFDENGNFIKIR